jgi:hypothetical protein
MSFIFATAAKTMLSSTTISLPLIKIRFLSFVSKFSSVNSASEVDSPFTALSKRRFLAGKTAFFQGNIEST